MLLVKMIFGLEVGIQMSSNNYILNLFIDILVIILNNSFVCYKTYNYGKYRI